MKKRMETKKIVSWLLVGSMILGLIPMSSMTSTAAVNAKGEFMTEDLAGALDGKLVRVPYNNEDITIDLGETAWSTMVVGDANEDGYMDLIVGSGTSIHPLNAVYYGTASSQNPDEEGYLLMEQGRSLTSKAQPRGNTFYNYGYDEETGKYLYKDYQTTVVTQGSGTNGLATNYLSANNSNDYKYNFPTWDQEYYEEILKAADDTLFEEERKMDMKNLSYTLADYDGDGLVDLIGSRMDWDEYGWNNDASLDLWHTRYDENGVWGDGDDPIHGWVFWYKNKRNAEDYEDKELSETVAKDANGDAPEFAEPEVVLVYDYTTDEHGNKTIIEDSAHPLDVYGNPDAQFKDWDADGDLDIICASFLNDITYFENIGEDENELPIFVEGRTIPTINDDGDISGILEMEYCSLNISSADWNKDDYMDLFVSGEDGRVYLVENTGETDDNHTPIMSEPKAFQTPASNVKIDMMAFVQSVDWDGDGDEDIISGSGPGFITYLENLSIVKENGEYVQKHDLTNPSWARPVRLQTTDGEEIHIIAGVNGSIQGPSEELYSYTCVSVGDWDNDGIKDLMVNSILGRVVWYRGTAEGGLQFEQARPVEVEWTGETPYPEWNWWKPEGKELVTQWRTIPYMIDLPVEDNNEDGVIDKNDGDGLMDLVIVDHEGYLSFLERYEAEDGTLKLKEGQRIFKNSDGSPMRMTDGVEGRSGRVMFMLVDYNMDGQLDLISDNEINAEYAENISSIPGEYRFAESWTLHERQLDDHTVCPTACDWNKDGVPDILMGAEDGHMYYMLNNAPTEEVEEEEEDSLDKHLVAHWDFEGEGNEVYQDKATAGDCNDNITDRSTDISVQNGIAEIPASTSYMTVPDSADLDITGEMTIFTRVLINQSNVAAIFDKNAAYHLQANGTSVLTSLIDSSGKRTNFTESNNLLTRKVWKEIAVVISKNADGYFEVEVLQSTSTSTLSKEDFVTLYKVTTEIQTRGQNDDPLYIGSRSLVSNSSQKGLIGQMDDFRIYDKALSKEELAGLMDHSLVAHWDFEGKTEAKMLADKAPNDGVSDNLTKVVTDSASDAITISNGVATLTGTGSVFTAADSADLDVTGPMTIFARVNLASGNATILEKKSSYSLNANATNILLTYLNGPGNNTTTEKPVKRNTWREIAVVVDYNNEGYITLQHYISNGELTETASDFTALELITTSKTTYATSNELFYLGNNSSINKACTSRQIDDVQIYNRALTPAELATLWSEPEPEEADTLVAHWDFNGANEAEALKDKATGGTIKDDLTKKTESGIAIDYANGTATFTDNGALVASGNSADLSQTGAMTLFARVKVTGSTSRKTVGLVDKRGNKGTDYGLTINTQENLIFGTYMGTTERTMSDFTGQAPTDALNDWREIAVVISRDSRGYLEYELLMSKNTATNNGEDFVTIYKKRTPYTEHLANTAVDLLIGNDYDLGQTGSATRIFDDVRIYSEALTADALADLMPASVGNTTSYYLKSLENNVKLYFDAYKTNYSVETTAETFIFTPVSDDAVTMKVNGAAVASGSEQTKNLSIGNNTFTIKLGDGTNDYKTYTITVTRKAVASKSVDALRAEIDAATALLEGNYSASSLAELQTAITNAETVISNEQATEDDRIAVSEALQAAVRTLTSDMRYVDLETLVSVLKADTKDYSSHKKYAEYAEQLEKANAVLLMKAPSSREIVEIYAALSVAYEKVTDMYYGNAHKDSYLDVRDLVAMIKVKNGVTLDIIDAMLRADYNDDGVVNKDDIVAFRTMLVQ